MKRTRSNAELFDLWAAPLLLVAIATNQVRMAHTADLTPWKGGGFGMFASSDTPGARTVGCVAEDLKGNPVRIDVGASGATRDLIRQLRCAPTEAHLSYLGEMLLRGEFVRIESASVATLDSLERQNPDLELPSLMQTSEPFYRLRSNDDPALEADDVIRLSMVRLQMYRLVFDDEDVSRTCVPFGDEIVVTLEDLQ